MNQNQTFHGDVDQLLKTSKQLQNKLRKELSQEVGFSCGGRQTLPLGWDDVKHNPYLESVVASYLVGSVASNKCIRLEQDSIVNPDKPYSQEVIDKTDVQVTKPQNVESKELIVASQKMFATVGTQVTQNQLQEHSQKKGKTNMKSAATSPNKTKRLSAKSGNLEARKNQRDCYTPKVKPTLSLQHLPMQRFVGTSKEKIDFDEEHPNLELDTSSNRSTLFPRRMPKGVKTNIPLLLSPDSNSLNLATATTKQPKPVLRQQQETWKDVLQNNSSNHTGKLLQLKKSVEVTGSHKELSEPKVKEPKDIEIILKPPNGLFHLEKQTGRLSKQNQCKFQHFPVMYIRPECQVQRVANISIGGICTEMENFSTNVKYVECMHEEKEKSVEEDSSSSRAEVNVPINKSNHFVTKKDNRYFKALESTDNLKELSVSRELSFLPSKSSANLKSIYSRSSSIIQQSTSLYSVESSDNDMHQVIEDILSATDRPYKKDVIKNSPTRREVYVQTDYKEPPAKLHSQLPREPPSLLPPSLPPVANLTPSITSSEHDNYVEDDFITKIFERMRNDVPRAVQAFKDWNTNAHQAVPAQSTTTKQHQEHNQSHHHQMSAISNASNVDLLPNEIEPGLERIQGKRDDGSHTILQMPHPIDSSVSLPSLSGGCEDRDFLLLQHNPLFEQTINRIKPSAITSDDRIKEDRQKYPTDAEIKSAVRIFLDSLALDDDGVGNSKKKKSIIKYDAVRKIPGHLRSKLMSSRKVTKYVSSDSSNSSSNRTSSSKNVKKTRNLPRSDVSESSTSITTSSSNSEQETDVTVDSRNHMNVTSLSEGEVLSIGEI